MGRWFHSGVIKCFVIGEQQSLHNTVNTLNATQLVVHFEMVCEFYLPPKKLCALTIQTQYTALKKETVHRLINYFQI